MSHHYSGPNIGFPRGDARLDLTDLYAFPKPGAPGRSVMIINFHPSVGLKPPGPTTAEPFAPEALYELMIDTDGDATADIAYQVRFSPTKTGGQTATLRRIEGAQAARTGERGQTIAEGMPVSMGREAQRMQVGDCGFFAGWRSDPFFFDVLGTLNNFNFTALGPKEVGLWARTLIPEASATGGWVQADRGGRPNQTPFLTGEQNDAYLAGEPAGDARFVPFFAHALEHTGGYSPEEAKRVAEKLLPDLLRYNPTRPASFPDNGRALIDDVSDIFLGILTNGKVTGDNAGPHKDLLSEFPYLGPPHKAN